MSRARRVVAAIFACGLLLSTSFPAAADVLAKAAPTDGHQTFEATAINATAAAMNALHKCRDTGAICEITEVDGHRIRRAAELKPTAVTPLPLWRFDSDTATVFVGGSMHLLKESLLPLPQPFLDAFEQSDVLAIEVNPTAISPDRMADLARRFLVLEGNGTLETVLPSHTWHRLESRLSALGMNIAQVQRLKPGFLAVEIGRLRFQTLGYLPHLGVEQQLLRRIGDRRVDEIESIEAQFRLIGLQTSAVQAAMLEQALGPIDAIDAEVASLVTAWLSGDLDALIEAMRDDGDDVPGFDMFMRKMLDERNVTMADAAANYLDGDEAVFVLVGAGHLGGPTGMIEYLNAKSESKGWRSHRIASDGTRN